MNRRVLLVDDHVAILQGLQEILGSDIRGLEFGCAPNYETAFHIANEQPWHLAIVDLDLPGNRSGLELIRALHDAGLHIPILIYTIHSEDPFGLRALKAGAQGFLSKTDSPRELIKAVNTLLAGDRYISPALAELMARNLVRNSPEAPHEALSEREFAVLRALAQGQPIIQIAADLRLSPKTVSTYRSRVLEKLHLKSTSDLIRYALAHKLIK